MRAPRVPSRQGFGPLGMLKVYEAAAVSGPARSAQGNGVLIWLGIAAILAAVIVMAPWRWALGVFLFWVPFSGTAVLMLGDDPVLLPLVLSVALLGRYVVSLADPVMRDQAVALIGRERWLWVFLAFATVSGILFPLLFAAETQTFQLQAGAWVLMPLGAQSVSLVQIAYLLLGGLTFFAVRHLVLRVGPAAAIAALVAQAGCIGALGFFQAVVGMGGVTVPTDWVANNAGAVLHLGLLTDGFARVTGVFVEASYFATWGAAALALCFFLLLNRIMPRVTLALTLMLTFTMLVSTSTTAYAGLLLVGGAYVLTVFLDSDPGRRTVGLLLFAFGLLTVIAVIALALSAESGPLFRIRELIDAAVFGKFNSASMAERSAWTNAAIQSGFDTYLLGAGYGAVRSSGIIGLLFGGVGVIGTALFLVFIGPKIMIAFKRRLTVDSGAAAACAIALIPAIGVLAVSASELSFWHMFWCLSAVAASAQERAEAVASYWRTAPQAPPPAAKDEPEGAQEPAPSGA